jgi:hypothetical protein
LKKWTFVEGRFILLNPRYHRILLLPGWFRSANGTARGCIQNQLAANDAELSVDQQ